MRTDGRPPCGVDPVLALMARFPTGRARWRSSSGRHSVPGARSAGSPRRSRRGANFSGNSVQGHPAPPPPPPPAPYAATSPATHALDQRPRTSSLRSTDPRRRFARRIRVMRRSTNRSCAESSTASVSLIVLATDARERTSTATLRAVGGIGGSVKTLPQMSVMSVTSWRVPAGSARVRERSRWRSTRRATVAAGQRVPGPPPPGAPPRTRP